MFYEKVSPTVYLEKLKAGEKGANPFFDWAGVIVDSAEDSKSVLRLPVRHEFLQGAGAMQGGLITCLADEAIAHAVITTLAENETTVTIEIKTNFMYPVSGGELTAKGSLIKRGRSVIVGEAVVTNEKGKLVAKSTGTFMVLEIK